MSNAKKGFGLWSFVYSATCALTLVSVNACAQSSVTIFGALVDGVVYANNVGGSSQTKLQSGVTWPNYFGLMGSEDIGGGSRILFNLASTFDLNSGSTLYGPGSLFDAMSYVGVSDANLGTMLFGRQYDYTVDLMDMSILSANTISSAHPGGYDRMYGAPLSNAVSYESPRLAGLIGKAMYSFGSASGMTNTRRSYSFALNYEIGGFKAEILTTSVGGNAISPGTDAGIGYFLGQSFINNRSAVVDLRKTDIYGGAANYTIGDATLKGVFTDIIFEDAEGKNKSSIKNIEASVLYKLRPDIFLNVGYTYSYADNSRWHTINLAVDYFLSKRTDVMFVSNIQKVSGQGQVASLFTVGNSASSSQFTLVASIRHRF